MTIAVLLCAYAVSHVFPRGAFIKALLKQQRGVTNPDSLTRIKSWIHWPRREN